MDHAPRCANTSQARMLAACLMLTVDAAWAGGWAHDSIDGAVTVAALPGGQATLARDGADRQARTITYVSTEGTTTTITRDYGPSGHKAVEVENGTVRQHVYGAGLSPLLRVEGDGSLSYQVGMDTISVDATGGTTMAHRIADIKRSTVAVLDAGALPRQRVSYGTLGQSRREQESDNAYTDTAQWNGYEGLRVWRLDSANQLLDNRARVYFPVAGRFLALDAAGQALAYEARGNNWIMFADYDGHMTHRLIALVNAVIKDPSMVLAIGEVHDQFEGLLLLITVLRLLEKQKAFYRIYSEEDLLFDREWNLDPRLLMIGAEALMKKLLLSGRLRALEMEDKAPELALEEETEILRQLKYQNPEIAARMMDYTFEIARSRSWDIRYVKRQAREKNVITILYTGSGHLQKLPADALYFQRRADGKRYDHAIFHDDHLSYLQPHNIFNIGYYFKLVSVMPTRSGKRKFRKIAEPHWETRDLLSVEYRVNDQLHSTKEMEFVIFGPIDIVKKHPSLKRVFKKPSNIDDPEDEKTDDNVLPNVQGLHTGIRQAAVPNHADHELGEEKKTEDK